MSDLNETNGMRPYRVRAGLAPALEGAVSAIGGLYRIIPALEGAECLFIPIVKFPTCSSSVSPQASAPTPAPPRSSAAPQQSLDSVAGPRPEHNLAARYPPQYRGRCRSSPHSSPHL